MRERGRLLYFAFCSSCIFMGLPLFLPATNTVAEVVGAGAPREPAGGRGLGKGSRGEGCATSASPRSIFKAPSGLGQPPALPCPRLRPPGPRRSRPPLRVSRPGHRGDGEGPRAAPPPRGLRLCAQRGSGSGRGPSCGPPALALLGSFSLTPSRLLDPAFRPIRMTSQLRRAYALMHN